MKRLNEKGALSVLALAFVLIFAGMGFGIWGYLRHWRHLVQLQFRLDRCVGETALNLVSTMDRVEMLNSLIKTTRAAIAGCTFFCQSVIPILLNVQKATVVGQDLSVNLWNSKAIPWLIKQGCDNQRDRAGEFPKLDYTRDLPDELGLGVLSRSPGALREFHIQVSHSPRHAAAVVKREDSGGQERARWTSPH